MFYVNILSCTNINWAVINSYENYPLQQNLDYPKTLVRSGGRRPDNRMDKPHLDPPTYLISMHVFMVQL